MSHLVFFLEEPSAREMLRGLLPKLVPENINIQYVVFEGKQDLEKRLPGKLRAWQRPDCMFVVMRDQDNGNCIAIKQDLVQKCARAGKPDTLIRIACRELESFYLGDLSAVAASLGPAHISRKQGRAKFRDPDKIIHPAQELKKLAPTYQKVAGSRAIAPCLDVENNHSASFGMLVDGIRRLIDPEVAV